MKMLAVAALASFALVAPGFAQTSTSPGGATKMSQADCTSEWSRLDASNTGSVGQPQAQNMISDFSSADTDKDGKLSRTEFMSACDKGLVRSSSTGTGTGSRGISGSDTTPGSTPGTSTTPGSSTSPRSTTK
jgi:hypothetical protein